MRRWRESYLNIYQILCVSKYFHQLKNLTNIPNFITPTSFPGTKNQCQKFSFGIWSQVKNLLSHKLISQFINLLSRRNPLKYLCFLVYLKLDWISVFVISHKWYIFMLQRWCDELRCLGESLFMFWVKWFWVKKVMNINKFDLNILKKWRKKKEKLRFLSPFLHFPIPRPTTRIKQRLNKRPLRPPLPLNIILQRLINLLQKLWKILVK